ncbi:hypothetical protein DY000_02031985 [Brassica cretica]|uniref:Uncharacterized protein n=1 Tax=Brassica cretica TaxID=69181 RepID=A0ABQ7DUH4_BRACR|nr:hypothetical protein DY000_02031985 [Brassica cretica]
MIVYLMLLAFAQFSKNLTFQLQFRVLLGTYELKRKENIRLFTQTSLPFVWGEIETLKLSLSLFDKYKVSVSPYTLRNIPQVIGISIEAAEESSPPVPLLFYPEMRLFHSSFFSISLSPFSL